MRRTDHILALTSTILRSDAAFYQDILARVEQAYVTDENRRTGMVSIGSSNETTEASYRDWIGQLRNEGIRKLAFNFFQAGGKLEAHIAAAFAGSTDLLMHVTTALTSRTYALIPHLSPQHEITPEQFILLLDSQPQPALLRDRAATLILESNRLNNKTEFNPANVIDYLHTAEGRTVFEYLVSNLVEELQIEATINNLEFVIPDQIKELFKKYGTPSMFFTEGSVEHVYLYNLRDVTAIELLALADAQPFGLKTWEQLNVTIKEYDDPAMQTAPPGAWEGKIAKMDMADLSRYTMAVCRSICTLCEQAGTKPVIPIGLRECFGPDEIDQKRAAARSKGSGGGWLLEGNRNNWEYYEFLEIKGAGEVDIKPTEHARAAFIKALEEARSFAESMQSPFEEAFRLSLYVLSDHQPAASYSQESAGPGGRLASAGFSQQALAVITNADWLITGFASLGWDDQHIKDLLALSISDVFGGMGSWNDQYFEDEQERYTTVSANLFEALRRQFAAVLSWGD